MTKDELEEHLNKEPFVPFRINMADGNHYDVENPRLAVAMNTRMFLAYPDGNWTFVVLRHVTSIESLQAA